MVIAPLRLPLWSSVLRESGEKGIKAAIIITSGFSEAGNAAGEEEVKAVAREYGIRYIGPNCAGLANTHASLFATLEARAPKGRTALVSQSGAVGGATAFNYSILWREAAIELLPEARRQNMGIMLASPTQQGWLAHRYDSQVDQANSRWLNKPRREQLKMLYALVDETGIPLPELSLRWALMNPDASTVLTGPRNLDQLRQNARAAEVGPLSKDTLWTAWTRLPRWCLFVHSRSPSGAPSGQIRT